MSRDRTSHTRRRPTPARAATSVAFLVCLTAGAAGAASGTASARTAPAAVPRSGTATTVTIKAEGVDLSGTVKSTRQSCVTGRTVSVFKQIGTRGGGEDQKFASKAASANGSWDTGNTGVAGHVYAKVKATTTCGGDTSPTIRATR